MGEHDRASGGVNGVGTGEIAGREPVKSGIPVWDDQQWLLGFVADRHVPCPRCAYDLRNLTTPQCPECGERLALRVGMATPRFGLLVLAMAPGVFSGVCATLLAFPLFRFRNAGTNGPPTAMYVAEAFGLLSVAAACGLYVLRQRFLGKTKRTQILVAVTVWLLHVLMFVGLVASIQ